MTLELEIDVPENRQVTFTLPPAVPTGRTKVALRVELPDERPVEFPPFQVETPPPPADKFAREKAAFYRLLPELLKTHRGQYVAVHDEQVVETGTEKIEVAMATFRRVGAVPIFVELVTEEPRVVRILSPRIVRREVKQ